MNKLKIIIIISFIILAGFIGFIIKSHHHKGHLGISSETDIYYCPMHPSYTSDKTGDCPICGMSLVKKQDNKNSGQTSTIEKKQSKILYYRNPMNPRMTSPVPMKDPMGMDYIAVFEEETKIPQQGIYISPEKQQLIGVKKDFVKVRHLEYLIRAAGKIAIDPDLYIAQKEYIERLKDPDIQNDKQDIKKAQQRLMLLGMSQVEIKALVKRGKPQENLFLPDNQKTAWAYLTIYEYEIGMVKEGQEVEIETIAYPGEEFKGNVISISPVLDTMTRTILVRAEIENTDNKLKPEMFVNAKIKVDLGLKLAVPESAVMDTGTRKIVYVSLDNGQIEMREIVTGQKAEGYYEVLKGLKAEEIVITSGNFLIDSESKIKSAR